MIWIAPSEKDTDNAALEKRLWDAADQFRANSGLKSQEYSAPVLGLIFLRFAEVRFAAQRAKLEKASAFARRGSRVDEPAAYHAEGILYLPAEARFDYLLNRPEAENIGAKVNAAMRDIEKHNPQLAGVLPKTYNLFTSTLLKELLKKVSEIPASLDYDAFGRIYEYFLAPWERVAAPTFSGSVQGSPTGRGEFAMSEGQGGGEFYTPSSIVIANPPLNVNAVDKERLKDMVGPGRRFPFGLPRTDNANYLWIQLFHSALNEKGRAGFVMANSASDARSSEQELRRQLIESRAVDVMVAVGPNLFYTVTLPCTLWFLDKSKSSRRRREETQTSPAKISQSLVTSSPTGGVDRADTVLFIDARHIYRQVDRAHREWTPAQIGFLANLVRLYRGEALDFTLGGEEARAKLQEVFGVAQVSKPAVSPISKSAGRGKSGASSNSDASAGLETGATMRYRDVAGRCRAATLKEIEAQGCSLNPGRYVGAAPGEAVSDEDFKEQLETLNEELETLNAQACDLEQTIAGNVAEILSA